MTAILLLLALLAVAALASHRARVAFAVHIAATPLLVSMGALLSPRGLGFILPSMAQAMTPALQVATTWLAMLVGLRVSRPSSGLSLPLEVGRTSALALWTWVIAAVTAWGGINGLRAAGLPVQGLDGDMALQPVRLGVLCAAMVCGTGLTFAREAVAHWSLGPRRSRVLFMARHDDAVGAVALALAVFLWPAPETAFSDDGRLGLLVLITFGVGIAVAYMLFAGRRVPGQSTDRVALVGLVVAAAGLADAAGIPGAAVGFLMGWTLAGFGVGHQLLDRTTRATERPVRMVVLVLTGVHLGLGVGAVLLGLVLAAGRLVAKAIAALALSRKGEPVPVSVVLGSSGVAIPMTVSLALTRDVPLDHSGLVTAVVMAVGVTDLLALLLWRETQSTSTTTTTAKPVESGA
ncbi:MAG: hypothetical protein AB2A00_16120 [Myxococcota bacterium]